MREFECSDVKDDAEDNVSFSLALRKCPKPSNSSLRRRRKNEDSKEIREFKQLTTRIITQMKHSFNIVSRVMGQEINDKQVVLNEEWQKIGGLTTIERLRATTQIARDSVTLNVFYSLSEEDRETWVNRFLNGEI